MYLRTGPLIIRLFNIFFIRPCTLSNYLGLIGLQKGQTLKIKGINREESV